MKISKKEVSYKLAKFIEKLGEDDYAEFCDLGAMEFLLRHKWISENLYWYGRTLIKLNSEMNKYDSKYCFYSKNAHCLYLKTKVGADIYTSLSRHIKCYAETVAVTLSKNEIVVCSEDFEVLRHESF